jgi:NAD+ kinase
MELARIYIVANSSKGDVLRALTDLKVWCQERRIEAIPVTGPVPRDAERAIGLCLGGDGTVLHAARLFADSDIPILGINLGSLGVLTQAPVGDLTHALEHVLAEEFTIEERMRLSYRVSGTAGTVLNDLVLTGAEASPFCEVELAWGDGQVASFPGDGLILATATGSTAYSLSAGGPVIVPPAACILATPLAAHKLGVRPVVFPPDELLQVRALTDLRLIADGDPEAALPAGSTVRVTRAQRPTQLLRLADAPGFFHVLNGKLNWADPQDRRPPRESL